MELNSRTCSFRRPLWERGAPASPPGAATQAFHAKAYGKDFAYEDFAPMWTNELFNATEWAQLFKRAGARGLTMTSKHHEGFTLWPSAQLWMWNAVIRCRIGCLVGWVVGWEVRELGESMKM